MEDNKGLSINSLIIQFSKYKLPFGKVRDRGLEPRTL